MQMKDIIKIHHGNQFGFSRHYLLLYSIVLGLETKLAFEFGTGQSTKVIIEALKKTKGKLISNDVRDADICGITSKDQKKYSDIWQFLQGRSNEVLSNVEESGFDFVLHDGAHDGKTVLEDLQFIIPKMKKNGILLVHDTEYEYEDIRKAVGVALQKVKHQRIELPYGCGLSIIRIRQDFGNGKVKVSWKKKKDAGV